MRVPSAFELIWRESNGSVVNACRWHAEPTLTEPAGENSTPLISTKEKGRHQPSFFFGGSERTRGSVQAASKKRKRNLSATNGSGERLARPIRRMGCGFRLPAAPSRRSPPEQANPNCFVTTELFGFVFYFDPY